MHINLLDDLLATYDEIYENPHAFLISYANLDKQLKKMEANQF